MAKISEAVVLESNIFIFWMFNPCRVIIPKPLRLFEIHQCTGRFMLDSNARFTTSIHHKRISATCIQLSSARYIPYSDVPYPIRSTKWIPSSDQQCKVCPYPDQKHTKRIPSSNQKCNACSNIKSAK